TTGAKDGRLVVQANKINTQISSFAKVKSQVATLTDAATRIALPSAWTARTASSSAPTSATITATSTADATSFTLDVDQLAKQQSVSSPTFTAGQAPGAGTLKIRLGTWTTAGTTTTFSNAATTLAGTAVTGYATALADGDITINGTSIGVITADTTAAARGKQISEAITNKIPGVTATYDSTTGAVALSSASGNDIVLATTTAAVSSVTGLGASGTVSGDVSIAVTATDTVATIAAKINTAGAGVLATAFNDGTNDRLLLRSKSTGTAAGFRIQSDVANTSELAKLVFDPENKAGIGMASDPTGSPVTYAVDAKARINGLAVSSGTNTLTGNIPGVTIKLVATTTTDYGLITEVKKPITMSVSEDVTPAVRNVSDLATAYNALMTTLKDLTKYAKDPKTQKMVAADFQGDASVVGLINMMRGVAGSASLGATSQYLSDVGLQIGTDGLLTINNAKLTTAANDGTSMQKLFTQDNSNALTNGFALKFKALGKDWLNDGSLSASGLKIQGAVTAKETALADKLTKNSKEQTKVLDRADTLELQLRKRYSALDGEMGKLTALNAYVSQQVTQWNKSTA
ncbi:MAG: flagellar filament capping protein FliD, partial [Betaproteobacteria bacterium]